MTRSSLPPSPVADSSDRNHRRRISFFVPSMAGGGAERSFALLANGLVARGMDVDLVLVRAHGPWLASIDPRVSVVDLKARRTLLSILPLARYLRRQQPCALVTAMEHANVVAILARLLARTKTRLIPSIRFPIGAAAKKNRMFRQRATRVLARLVYKQSDAIISISDGVRSDLLRSVNYPPERVITVYNPIIEQSFWDRADADPIFSVPREGDKLVLAVGRLRPVKGFDTLIRAFAHVRRAEAAHLMILGEGPERENLESLASSLGISPHVSLPGFDPNPLPYMKRADVFVSSSIWEGFGNAIAEAMALGTSTVCTRTEGPTEILEDGKWGRLVPVGDEVSLADAICDALNEPGCDPSPRGKDFTLERALDGYLAVAMGSAERC